MAKVPAQLDIRTKRIYEPPGADDGVRILIDGLWPRGLKKSEVAIDLWMRELAPSAELRRWFGHDPARWDAFRAKYKAELASKRSLVQELRAAAEQSPLTLLYAARDEQHNNAVVLRDLLVG